MERHKRSGQNCASDPLQCFDVVFLAAHVYFGSVLSFSEMKNRKRYSRVLLHCPYIPPSLDLLSKCGVEDVPFIELPQTSNRLRLRLRLWTDRRGSPASRPGSKDIEIAFGAGGAAVKSEDSHPILRHLSRRDAT